MSSRADNGHARIRVLCVNVVVTSAKEEDYVFVVVCLFACLFVGNFAQKLPNGFCVKFSGNVLAMGQ